MKGPATALGQPGSNIDFSCQQTRTQEASAAGSIPLVCGGGLGCLPCAGGGLLGLACGVQLRASAVDGTHGEAMQSRGPTDSAFGRLADDLGGLGGVHHQGALRAHLS